MKSNVAPSILQTTESENVFDPIIVDSEVFDPMTVPDMAFRRSEAAPGPLGASPPTTSPVNASSRQTSKSKSSSSHSNPSRLGKISSSRVSNPITTNTAQEGWEYDVYAAPFIPSGSRSINLEVPFQTVQTRSRHQVDYPKYISTFIGTDFLSQRSLRAVGTHTENILPMALSTTMYKAYFTLSAQREYAAKARENEGHALYHVPLCRIEVPDDDPVWALTIPGLREDSPFLEMGDTLQLRRLRLDANGRILSMPMPGEGSEYLPGGPIYYKGWTGVQYDVCIFSVNRARELVYLKADGLLPVYGGYDHNPVFVNLILPSKHVKHHSQQKVIDYVASQLTEVVPLETKSSLKVNSDQGLNVFRNAHVIRDASNNVFVEEVPISHNDWVRRMLFPTEEDGLIQTHLRGIPHRQLFDHAINFEQAHAVKSVCDGDYGTLPYLISGPPGTGKTKTLVEIAMQLLHTSRVRHMLICAPSEAAADTLALRLKHYLSHDQLFRLIRPGRADNEVPGELTQFCYVQDNMFALPPFRSLMAYNIVVASCQDAGILFEARLTNADLWHIEINMLAAIHPYDNFSSPSLHWGALLIDEAAQATEVDVLPAISVVCSPPQWPTKSTQPLFVLAGDENQLGPKTASHDSNLSTSLFARLADRPLYKAHPLSRLKIKPSAAPPVLKRSMLPIIYPPFTNLIRNYRSHPAILSVPNSLFYNDTLIPEAPQTSTPLQHSSLWRGKKWPVLFIPNSALDEIERDGGGWYNTSEAHIACNIAQTLIYEAEVEQKDICIMSPFAAQVRRLRTLIRSPRYGGGKGLWDVNIGPLEAFQGLEKRVVILCTTRTRERFLKEDEKRGLGIVYQKRKMNVALTRAKQALFVIGNPEILMLDEHWRQWLAFCARNGLVDDRGEGWDAGREDFGIEKIGVLERALIAKEDLGNEKAKVLGGGHETLDMSRDYEVWMESLREAMDEESEDGVDDESGNVDDGVN
jgi:helicase MOV-10